MSFKLPEVLGRYTFDADLSKITWFQVGGKAEVLFKPKDVNDLTTFLKGLDNEIPIFILGVGSNLLVRDGGVDGVVIRLGKGFNDIFSDGEEIEVGSAVLDRNIAEYASNKGIAGLEFLASIPGTLGGAIKMNAGCYGREIKDVLLWADVLSRDEIVERKLNRELNFSYRHSNIRDDEIIVKARLRGQKGCQEDIQKLMQEMLKKREETQPVKSRTGGSTFANPVGDQKAWELIDAIGGRGLSLGGAQFSNLHCNFLINTGNATAKDLESLGETVRAKVFEKFNVHLKWEICRIGKS